MLNPSFFLIKSNMATALLVSTWYCKKQRNITTQFTQRHPNFLLKSNNKVMVRNINSRGICCVEI